MSGIPTRSDSANQSLGLFYRPLQQIEIYVEDVNAEAIYTELLKRVTNNGIRIKKVISLEGREKVVSHCKTYNEDFPALFIIDGDLDLLHEEREGPLKRLFQHRFYCLENALICPEASMELLRDSSGRLVTEKAIEMLEWDTFIENIQSPLLELFKVYAVSWKVFEENRIATVSRSYYKMCDRKRKPIHWELCHEKVAETIEEIRNLILQSISPESYQELYDSICSNISKLGSPLYAISGKDYLLTALREHLASKGASYSIDDGFKFKLARYCNTEPLEELGEAVMHTVKDGPYYQAY